MSADSWTDCPRCAVRLADRKREAREALEEAYGHVSRREWEALSIETAEIEGEVDGQTFREDYEFYGAETGKVTAVYHGECKTCGLEAFMDYSVTFYPEDSPD
jgi:ribosomal protein S27AE